MSARTLHRISCPFFIVLGLSVYGLLISLAESCQKVYPNDPRLQKGDLLVEVEVGDLLLDLCPGCRGIWFDDGELEYLLKSLDLHGKGISVKSLLHQPSPETAEDQYQCPVCRSVMGKAGFAGFCRLMVDVCPQGHGVWFHGGECETLIQELGGIGTGQQVVTLSLFKNNNF